MYKSKEKFLEKNGKRWSFCHVDPAGGVPCRVHNHKYPMGSLQQQWDDPYMLKYFENLELKKSDLQDEWGEDIIYFQVPGKPFGITDRKMIHNGVTLTQVVGTEDFNVDTDEGSHGGVILRGTLGGFVEKPEGLVDGWVGDNGYVYGNSIIDGGVYVYDSTLDSVTVNASGSIVCSKVSNSVLTGKVDLNFCTVNECNLDNLVSKNSTFEHNSYIL